MVKGAYAAYIINNSVYGRESGMRICEMRDREVINICTCRRLGYVADVEFDPENGCITAFIVPGPARIWGCLGRDTEYVIPFCCVRQIGADIILVEVNEEEVFVKCT